MLAWISRGTVGYMKRFWRGGGWGGDIKRYQRMYEEILARWVGGIS